MPETGTPTLDELAVAINNEGAEVMAAAAEGRFEDARDAAKRAWAYAEVAHDIELNASLRES